jgi:signal transduction histidine kinase
MRVRIPWLILFIIIILILSSFALYFYVERAISESTELRLFNWADNLLLEIARDPDHFKKSPSDFLFRSTSNEFISSGVLVEFIGPSGKVIARSPSLKREFLPFYKNEDDVIKDLEMEDGTELKIYQRSIELEGEKLGSLIVGVPTSQIYHTLNWLKDILAIVMFCTVIILGFGINAIVSIGALNEQRNFLNFASHELRTPLAIIQGNAEVALRDNSIPADYRKTLATIKEEADWMSKHISNLLMVFRSHAGRLKLNKTEFNLGELLADCASSIKIIYPQKQIILNLPEEAEIFADLDQIKRLIMNLVENAARHTAPDGEIRLELESRPKIFILKVKDNGRGISKDAQKKIFKAFYQVEQGKGGAGLGLAISKWIVDAHKGKIQVKSEIGKGSEFVVTLPVK